MSDKIKIIRIFIGSPGGLDEERQAAHGVVESVNRSHSERWGCQFKLLGWETAVPGYIRPQSKINEDFDRCDYFIGVLWDRWGSAPSNEPSGYTSGFEEEYERAKSRINDGLMKDLAIYFKEIDVPTGLEPGPEIKKVFQFRQQCIEQKIVFFKPFKDITAFRDMVREKLEEIGWLETELITEQSIQESRPKNTSSKQNPHDQSDFQGGGLIDGKAQTFLSDISQRSASWEETSSHEVARFRLISTSVSRHGNDDYYLGNHDANLIFKHFDSTSLSEQETQALISCGVVGFGQQNVPLWRWLASHDKKDGTFEYLRLLATAGSTSEQKNAIRILQLIGQPIPTHDSYFNKQGVLETWFAEDTESSVFDAAIAFLSANGQYEDIQTIEKTSSTCSPSQKSKIEGAIIGIIARTNVHDALKQICERSVDKIENETIEKLFESPQSLATNTLVQCLSAKAEDIRFRSVQILFERNEISKEVAQTLLTDNNHEIRLVAAEQLNRMCQPLEDKVLKTVLTAKKAHYGLGISKNDQSDSSFYERYKTNRLFECDLRELRVRIEEAPIFVERELSTLYTKFKAECHSEMVENLKDGFESHFQKQIETANKKFNTDLTDVLNLKTTAPFQKRLHCSNTLAALCALKRNTDLTLIRKTIDRFNVDAHTETLNYLARFGEWQDIERIKKLGDYPNEPVRLLSMKKTQLPLQKAKALLVLGKHRIVDLLDMEMDSQIRRHLLNIISNKTVKELSNDILLRELERKDDTHRIMFALKCVQSLSKVRITALLGQYVSTGSHRYYNSIHWLDLGASMPSRLAKNVARREMKKYS